MKKFVEVMSMQTVVNLNAYEKFNICHKCYMEEYEEDISIDEYIESTKEFFDENMEMDCYEEGYTFDKFLNDLTYSYVNNIHGTPYSLV